MGQQVAFEALNGCFRLKMHCILGLLWQNNEIANDYFMFYVKS